MNMFTSLDLLVVVFMVLGALTLLSLSLMFLIRNKTAKRVFFYIVSGFGLYMSWVGFRIGYGGLFPLQIAVGVLTALMCVGVFVLERVSKRRGSDKLFRLARILSAVVLAVAFFNAVF